MTDEEIDVVPSEEAVAGHLRDVLETKRLDFEYALKKKKWRRARK